VKDKVLIKLLAKKSVTTHHALCLEVKNCISGLRRFGGDHAWLRRPGLSRGRTLRSQRARVAEITLDHIERDVLTVLLRSDEAHGAAGVGVQRAYEHVANNPWVTRMTCRRTG